jgi:hypothetical protein
MNLASAESEVGGDAQGLYLYCIAESAALPSVNGTLVQAPAGVDLRYPITRLSVGGISAVVGQVAIAEFSEDNLQDLTWLGSRAARHEAVVVWTMGLSPILPVKFGTIFASRERLIAFLAQHRLDIASALERVRGKAEWSVKAYLVEAQARAAFAARDTEIAARLAALPTSAGARYLQQKRLDVMMDAALETGLEQASEAIGQALAMHAEASASLRCHSSAVTGRSERMVFNASFLLGPEQVGEFQQALAEQQQEAQTIGLVFELKGPWPPYNFCPPLARD